MDGFDSSYDLVICPISLQIMKDPVTISTQPLSDFRLTPNSNLLRLIQSWHLQHASSSSSSTKFAEPNHDALMKVKALRKIKSLIQENDGDNNKISCIRDDTLFSLAASLVVQTELPGIPQITGNDTPVIAEAYLSYLQIRIQAALVLKSIFEVVDGVYKEGLKFEFFENIIEILKDQNSKHGSVAVLSILIRVLKYGNNKEKAIKGGLIPILIELLAEDNDQGHVCEMMLVVLEKLCQKAEGRAPF
uniref:U-box domain-containing protein n=1 Tax=Salix viminalis TaxID=40686 RepID=A0A6N2MMU5_SALVM